MSYNLTKSNIILGIFCKKKLWFDLDESQRINLDHFNIHRGNVFEKKIKDMYGEGLNLSENYNDNILELTKDALKDPTVKIINEGAFFYSGVLVRTDVLIRKDKGWKLIEVKCSSSVTENHKQDIAIQYYVLKNSDVKITEATITHFNKEFNYKADDDYTELKKEVDVLNDIQEYVNSVPAWINDLSPITKKNSPKPSVEMGDHCKKCDYFNLCESETILGNIDTPISILPYKGNDLKKEWFEKGIYDLKDLPDEAVKDLKDKRVNFIEILKCHKQGVEWINPKFVEIINSFSWPRFFFDIESVKQAVPIIPNSKPDDQYPFQYSVHKWENKDQKLLIEDSLSFLEFNEDGMDRRFLISLIENLGENGPIFAHTARVEKGAIKYLSNRKNCLDLKPSIENITNRIVDTEQLLRENFYNPKMMGSYSLKNIVKVLPKASLYSSENNEVGSGGDAMIKWFEFTNPNTSNEQRQKIKDNLITYCAKDTLNLYHIFNYILSKEYSIE